MSAQARDIWARFAAATFGAAGGLVMMVFFFAVMRTVPLHLGVGLGVLALLFLGFGAFARRKSRG